MVAADVDGFVSCDFLSALGNLSFCLEPLFVAIEFWLFLRLAKQFFLNNFVFLPTFH